MKGLRFYEVYDTPQAKRKEEKSTGNIIAIDVESMLEYVYAGLGQLYTCLAATFFEPNSDVSCSQVHQDYLLDNCKRVSEKHAREVHPKLFARLEEAG